MTFRAKAFGLNDVVSARLRDAESIRFAIEERLAYLSDTTSKVPVNLQGAVTHALMGRSKRVRPVLLFLVAEPPVEQQGAALDLGCAVEMVHTASLILDDLPCMDDAKLRRERPTTHMVFGQATAILAAIALLSRAFGIIAELANVPEATRLRLTSTLSDAVGWNGLVSGQEIDINGRDGLVDAQAIEDLNWRKTGVLFAAAAEMGALLRGLEEERVALVRRFARHFGNAFQTADDLLDRKGSANEIGKDVQKDGNKTTLVSLFGASQAQLSCEEHLARANLALEASGVTPEPVRDLMLRLLAMRTAAAP